MITQQLRQDLQLRNPNWDSYGAAPITELALNAVDQFQSRWHATPCTDGGVQLEIHSHDVDLEITFNDQGKVVSLLTSYDRS